MPDEDWEQLFGVVGAPTTSDVIEQSKEASTGITDKIIGIWESIKDAVFGIAGAVSSIFDTIKSVVGAIAFAVISIAYSIYNGLVAVAKYIYGALQWIWEKIKEGFTVLWRWLKEAFLWVRDKVTDFIYAIVRTIMDIYNLAKIKLGEFADSIHDKIENAISGVVLSSRNKLIDMTVATMTIKGMWGAYNHFVAGDYKKAFLTGLFSPLMGAFAGAIMDAVIPKPDTIDIRLMPSPVIPQRDTYEQFNIENIPKHDFEAPLVLEAKAKVTIHRPIKLDLKAPIDVTSGAFASLSIIEPVRVIQQTNINLDTYVAIEKPTALVVGETSNIRLETYVWIHFESEGGYYTSSYP